MIRKKIDPYFSILREKILISIITEVIVKDFKAYTKWFSGMFVIYLPHVYFNWQKHFVFCSYKHLQKIANQPKILRIVNLGVLARKLSHLTYDGKEYIKLRGNQDALLLLEINVFFNCGKENDGLL